MPDGWITWTAWCPQCDDEWHTQITPVEVAAFATSHMHAGIKCMPDFLLAELTNQMFTQVHEALQNSAKGE